jgi:hypothetical protein
VLAPTFSSVMATALGCNADLLRLEGLVVPCLGHVAPGYCEWRDAWRKPEAPNLASCHRWVRKDVKLLPVIAVTALPLVLQQYFATLSNLHYLSEWLM